MTISIVPVLFVHLPQCGAEQKKPSHYGNAVEQYTRFIYELQAIKNL